MAKFAFVTNFVPAYRESFYTKLCSDDVENQWLLIHGNSGESARTATKASLRVPSCEVINHQYRLGPFTIRWQSGVLRAIRRFNPDVIVLLGISGTLSNWLVLTWAYLVRVPVVMWTCGWEPQRPESLAIRLKRQVARRYFRAASVLLTYSSKGKRYLEELGVAPERVRICYNGIEIDGLKGREEHVRVSAMELRRREGASNAKVVLFVGAMLPDKRLDLLIRAHKRVLQACSDAQLWLVGDGPEKVPLEAFVSAESIPSVRFFGRVVEGVEAYFAAADVVALPGIGGLAINEAMFWERPCVVGTADGTEDDLVLDGLTGRRFEDGDAESLATAIADCLALSEEEKTSWGHAARELIETRSNVSRMVESFRGALHDVCVARGNR